MRLSFSISFICFEAISTLKHKYNITKVSQVKQPLFATETSLVSGHKQPVFVVVRLGQRGSTSGRVGFSRQARILLSWLQLQQEGQEELGQDPDLGQERERGLEQ